MLPSPPEVAAARVGSAPIPLGASCTIKGSSGLHGGTQSSNHFCGSGAESPNTPPAPTMPGTTRGQHSNP
eukprot:11005319-Alexandrium_andersonii.AAC.1